MAVGPEARQGRGLGSGPDRPAGSLVTWRGQVRLLGLGSSAVGPESPRGRLVRCTPLQEMYLQEGGLGGETHTLCLVSWRGRWGLGVLGCCCLLRPPRGSILCH